MEEYIGKKYGFLKIISFAYFKEYGQKKKIKCKFVKCLCDCGKEKVIRLNDIRSGKTKSCGCLLKRSNKERFTKHNLCHTRIYRIYKNIKSRCKYSSLKQFKDYGGRGIEMCKEWENNFMSFYKWSLNNGYRDDLTIDRIDVNGNYCPENCRWATVFEQNNNKRTNHIIEYNGEKHSMREWCDILKLNYYRTRTRINNYGISIERAFNPSKFNRWNGVKDL